MKRILFFTFLIFNLVGFAQKEEQTNYFIAESYYREGAYEKAAQIYDQLYTKNKFNTTYLKRLISCYQETNQFLKAENLLKKRIQEDPRATYLNIFLGYNYDRQQQSQTAKLYYDIALKSLEQNPTYGAIMGRLFKDYSLLDNAISAYEKAMQINKNANYDFQIAQIYGEKGAYKEMFTSYVNLVDKNKSYLDLVQRYTSRYITDDAEDEINILFKKTLLKKSLSNPKNEWNILLSWLFSQQKEYYKAFIQEKALYERNKTDVSEIFSLGKIAFQDNALDAAKDCFAFVIEKTVLIEEKIEANLYLAKILVANKDATVDAFFQNLFTKFGTSSKTIAIQVEYANYLTFSKNNPIKATLILEKALELANSKFEKARIKIKLGDVLVFQAKYNKALIYYSQVQTKLKNHRLAQEARFKVAQTSYFKGDFTWAKAQLKVLKGSTTQLIANDAVELFLKITDNEPVDSIPTGLKQLAKAELLAYQNKSEEALQVVEDLFNDNSIGVAPGEPIYDDVLYFKTKLLIKQKKYDAAILSLAKIVAADNQGFLTDDVYYMMANIYQNHILNLEKAKEYYQKIIFEHPSSIYLVDARKQFRKLRGDTIN